MKTKILLLISVILLIPALALGSCGVPQKTNPSTEQNPTSIPGSSDIQSTETILPDVNHLIVWLPENLAGEDTARILELVEKQTGAFTTAYPDISVEVRVKSTDRASGYVELLQNTGRVAPASLPDLMLLDRKDMEVAAIKSLLIPYDELSRAGQTDDWSVNALALSKVQGSTFGLPAAGDSLVFVQAGAILPPTDLAGLFNANRTTIIDLQDPEAKFSLAVYMANGGTVSDTDGNPHIDADPLLQTLRSIDFGKRNGMLPEWLSEYQNPQDAIIDYSNGRANSLIAWYSDLTANIVSSSRVSPLPGNAGDETGLASGWFWVIANPNPERRTAIIQLAEVLVEPAFLHELAGIAQLLPVRTGPEKPTSDISNGIRLLDAARPLPDGLYLVTIGPVIHDAVQQVLNGVTPDIAVESALKRINRE